MILSQFLHWKVKMLRSRWLLSQKWKTKKNWENHAQASKQMSYIIPIWSTDPSKTFFFWLIPKNFHDKVVQSNILLLNSNKIDEMGSKHKYRCTQTASAVPKYFPCLLQFCTGYPIWHASWAWKRKTNEKCWFSHGLKYPDTSNTFSLFSDKFL